MIDEDLYQQAADELNSDRRRSALWARACALASDDHDEARFLYTNLRVEELLAEGNSRESVTSYEEEDANEDATLALEPLDATIAEGKAVGFLDDFTPSDSEEAPRSVSAPAGVDNKDADDGYLSLEQPISEEPDPDAKLMEDYVPDNHSDFDDTFEGTSVVSADDVAVALEEVARENQEPAGDSFDNNLSTSPSKEPIDSSPSEGFTTEGLAAAIASAKGESSDYSAEYSDEDAADLTQVSDMTHANDLSQASDLTQANVQVFDEHSDELDDMLTNAQQSPEDTGVVEDVAEDMSWLDNDDVTQRPSTPKTAAVVDHEEDPVVHEENEFANELNRQADELGFHAPDSELANMKQNLEDQARVFEEPDSSYITTKPVVDDSSYKEQEAHDQDSLGNGSDKGISVVGTGATAAVAAAAGIASTPDLSEPVTREYGENNNSSSPSPVSNPELELPLDLTSGRKGSEYEVYRRDVKAQAVKSGVSWSALFLTFPYLVYRHLFGTALVYAILWIISLGGLAIAGLAWVDAGTAVTPLIQACTIGFALIAFIGLIYLPFRYGNRWRAEKLENRGYELVAITKAPNPGKAIARARRHSALLS